MKNTFKSILNFIVGIVLFLLSLVLLGLLAPWGLLEILYKLFWRKHFWKGLSLLGDILELLAVIIDVLGNVILHIPCNRILITENGYKFGSRFDTISYVLGYNLVHGTLTDSGKKLCNILDFFEKDHCLKTYNKRNSKN